MTKSVTEKAMETVASRLRKRDATLIRYELIPEPSRSGVVVRAIGKVVEEEFIPDYKLA